MLFGDVPSCNSLFTPDGLDLIRELLNYFRILAPIALILFTSFDLFGVILNQDSKSNGSDVIGKIVRRTLGVVLLFFVPTIIRVIFELDGVKGMISDDPLCEDAVGTEQTYEIIYTGEYKKKKTYTEIVNSLSDVNMEDEYDNPSGSSNPSNPDDGNNPSGENKFEKLHYGNGDSKKRSYKTVTINGRTYDMYRQSYLGDIPFDGCDLAKCGCSAVAFASAVSGFNSDITVYDAAKMVNARTFTGIKNALNQVNIPYSGPYYYNSNDHDQKKVAEMAQLIRDHFAKGKPVIALITGDNDGERKYCTNNHFITLYGEDDKGHVIVGNAGVELGNLEEIIDKYMPGGRKGVLLVG